MATTKKTKSSAKKKSFFPPKTWAEYANFFEKGREMIRENMEIGSLLDLLLFSEVFRHQLIASYSESCLTGNLEPFKKEIKRINKFIVADD